MIKKIEIDGKEFRVDTSADHRVVLDSRDGKVRVPIDLDKFLEGVSQEKGAAEVANEIYHRCEVVPQSYDREPTPESKVAQGYHGFRGKRRF
ncbi:hypothetical protein KY317_04260 [Candidatus Woesearchaeota archaeon]|nr:hypothetical protein [Candidatus Woesearchaeota archaeon]